MRIQIDIPINICDNLGCKNFLMNQNRLQIFTLNYIIYCYLKLVDFIKEQSTSRSCSYQPITVLWLHIYKSVTVFRYILNTVHPPIETVVNCLDILIRLARDSEFVVNRILTCNGLLDGIMKHYFPIVLNPGKNANYFLTLKGAKFSFR